MFHAWPQKQCATNAGRQLAMFMVIAKRLSLNIFQFLTNEFLFTSNGLDLYAPYCDNNTTTSFRPQWLSGNGQQTIPYEDYCLKWVIKLYHKGCCSQAKNNWGGHWGHPFQKNKYRHKLGPYIANQNWNRRNCFEKRTQAIPDYYFRYQYSTECKNTCCDKRSQK